MRFSKIILQSFGALTDRLESPESLCERGVVGECWLWANDLGLSLGGPNAYLTMIAEFQPNLADSLAIRVLARYHLTNIVSSCTIRSFNQTDTFKHTINYNDKPEWVTDAKLYRTVGNSEMGCALVKRVLTCIKRVYCGWNIDIKGRNRKLSLLSRLRSETYALA